MADTGESKDRPAQNPLERERRGFSILAPIEDEIKERAKEDPFARFLLEGWKQVFIIAVAVFAVVYIRNAYVKNQETSRQSAADMFVQVRNGMEQMDSAVKKDAGEVKKEGEAPAVSPEELAKKVSEGIRALEDAREPYSKLASLYSALLAEKAGGKKEGQTASMSALPAEANLDRMVGELQLLAGARAKLSKPESIEEGKTLLKKLAAEGVFVNVDAAINVARFAKSPDERVEALAILQGIQNRQPEQGKLLGPELQRLGSTLSAS